MYIMDRYYRMSQVKKFLRVALAMEIVAGLVRCAYHGSLYILPTRVLPSPFQKVAGPATIFIALFGFYVVNSRASPSESTAVTHVCMHVHARVLTP